MSDLPGDGSIELELPAGVVYVQRASPVFRYFGKKDSKYVCLVKGCGKSYKITTATSNMKHHLAGVHNVIHLTDRQNTDVKIVRFFKKATESEVIKELPKSRVVDCYLMAATDLVAFNTVEHKGLRTLFEYLMSTVRMSDCLRGALFLRPVF